METPLHGLPFQYLNAYDVVKSHIARLAVRLFYSHHVAGMWWGATITLGAWRCRTWGLLRVCLSRVLCRAGASVHSSPLVLGSWVCFCGVTDVTQGSECSVLVLLVLDFWTHIFWWWWWVYYCCVDPQCAEVSNLLVFTLVLDLDQIT